MKQMLFEGVVTDDVFCQSAAIYYFFALLLFSSL